MSTLDIKTRTLIQANDWPFTKLATSNVSHIRGQRRGDMDPVDFLTGFYSELSV